MAIPDARESSTVTVLNAGKHGCCGGQGMNHEYDAAGRAESGTTTTMSGSSPLSEDVSSGCQANGVRLRQSRGGGQHVHDNRKQRPGNREHICFGCAAVPAMATPASTGLGKAKTSIDLIANPEACPAEALCAARVYAMVLRRTEKAKHSSFGRLLAF